VVLGRKFPLRIYVAEKGKLAQAQTELYQISKEALFARRDALIARLRGEKAQSEAAVAELQKRFGQELSDRFAAEDLLRKKMEEQEKQLPKFAMELAKKNLDNASQLYIQAYELFQQGEIGKVIALLDEEKLQASYAQVKEARARIEEEKALLADREEQARRQVLQVIESYSLKADALELEFRYGEMAEQYRQILTIHEESGLPLKERAVWHDKRGVVLRKNGKYASALVDYKQALELWQQVLVSKDTLIANSYANIGLMYTYLADYEQALTYQGKALAIQEKVLSPEHPALAQTYTNMGWVYDNLADYEQALAYHGKALAIQEKVLSPEHPDLAATYNNIGWVYGNLAEYEQLLAYYGKALAIWEKAFPDGHSNLGLVYSNIGATYDGLQKYPTAIDYQYKAIAMYRHYLPSEHPRLATAYALLGLVYAHTAQQDSARAYFNQHATIATDTALIHRNQALLALLDGTLPEALTHLEHAVAKGFKELGWLRQEPLLEPLHEEARYQALVESLSKDKENKE
jgi:preprotein translocase subunit SecA/nephrocystin-3